MYHLNRVVEKVHEQIKRLQYLFYYNFRNPMIYLLMVRNYFNIYINIYVNSMNLMSFSNFKVNINF
jgi:hypothetical protein